MRCCDNSDRMGTHVTHLAPPILAVASKLVISYHRQNSSLVPYFFRAIVDRVDGILLSVTTLNIYLALIRYA